MKKTLTAALTTAALAALLFAVPALSTPARADDGDAEDRFHRAYEAEVVEGKLADAAKTYLDLMRDEKAPPKIRAEAKFRFAVTALLLGRADEARAHFAELKNDPSLPEAMRSRAAEYLDSAKGIGVGSEVDKKMQALVFDLARVPANDGNPSAYRDFEIIGKPAVPFLRGLLQHDDLAIRTHAFRLLVRMDVPGMAAAWFVEFLRQGGPGWAEFNAYRSRHPDEAAAFEKRLLALTDEQLASVLGNQWFNAPVTADLLRAAAVRKVSSGILARHLNSAVAGPGGVALRDEWLRSDDAFLASTALHSMLSTAKAKPESVTADLPALRAIVTRLTGTGFQWQLSTWRWSGNSPNERVEAEGLVAIANRCPLDGVLDVLDEVVTSGEGWKGNVNLSPLRTGLADALAVAVEDAKPSGAGLSRYAGIVARWTAAATTAKLNDTTLGLHAHITYVLNALPRAEAEAAAVQLITGPATALPGAWIPALPSTTADHFGIALAAYRAAPPLLRRNILNGQRLQNPAGTTDPARAAAILAALPELIRDVPGWSPEGGPPVVGFVWHAQLLPPGEAGEALVAVVEAIAELQNQNTRTNALTQVLRNANDPVASARYFSVVVAPVAEQVLGKLQGPDRSNFLQIVGYAYDAARNTATRETIAAILRAHVEDLPQGVLAMFLATPDLFPLATWVPRANPGLIAGAISSPLPAEAVSAAIAAMAPAPERANASVRAFVRKAAPAELRTAFYDRILRAADVPDLTGPVWEINASNGSPASTEAIEEAIDRVVAFGSTSTPPDGVTSRLVEIAVRRHPSERLFPAIRLLLASAERDDVLAGIAAAQGLGRADLLPALADKLDSLDAEVRTAARAAIDGIVELGKLKDEARRRAAESGGGATPPK